MRIAFLANRDIHSNFALNILTNKLSHHSMTIYLSDHVGKKRSDFIELNQLRFIEQALFNDIVFSAIEKSPSALKRFLTFHELGDQTGNGVIPLNEINSNDGIEKLQSSDPDLIVSIRYGTIIQSAVIAIPRFGILNLHSGILPQYRGVMATFWAMLNSDKHIGCTLHYIIDGTIDTGPIVSIYQKKRNAKTDYFTNVIGLYPSGCELIIKAVKIIESGESLEQKSVKGESHYYTFPKGKEISRFKQKGYALINEASLINFVKKYYCYDLTVEQLGYR
ncbi:MAG: formyl transferase [Candidatus Neomarinimicrobiota bacterium]|nr:formyl transferase [Candidatus Neomarinimicrobiota bacterium]